MFGDGGADELLRGDGAPPVVLHEVAQDVEEGAFADLEAEQATLTSRLEDPAIYQTDPAGAQKAAERLAAIDDELMEMLERWETLESRAANSA